MSNIGNTVKTNVREWGVVGIVIVIVSVILLKFRANSSVSCSDGYAYNATADLCNWNTNTTVTAAVNDQGALLSTFVAALSEPKNWVVIVIIAVIGIGVLTYFNKLKG